MDVIERRPSDGINLSNLRTKIREFDNQGSCRAVVRTLIACAVKADRGVHPFVSLMPSDGSSWALKARAACKRRGERLERCQRLR